MDSKYFVAGLAVLILSFIIGWTVVSFINTEYEKSTTANDNLPTNEQNTQNSPSPESEGSNIADEFLPDEESVDLGSVLDTGGAPITTTPPASTPTTPTTNGISLTTLAKHNTKLSCWVGYKGKVYDVTSFLSKHPGGSAIILRYCGTSDAFSAAFNRQHGSKQDARLAREAIVKGDLA